MVSGDTLVACVKTNHLRIARQLLLFQKPISPTPSFIRRNNIARRRIMMTKNVMTTLQLVEVDTDTYQNWWLSNGSLLFISTGNLIINCDLPKKSLKCQCSVFFCPTDVAF